MNSRVSGRCRIAVRNEEQNVVEEEHCAPLALIVRRIGILINRGWGENPVYKCSLLYSIKYVHMKVYVYLRTHSVFVEVKEGAPLALIIGRASILM